MNIFSTKEEALISLNTSRITVGEIKVYRYYSVSGTEESFVVIGISDGIGPDCYQIMSKKRNLIVSIDKELPDVTRLIQGQVHVYPSNGVYHMIYLENTVRVDKEIKEGEVYYVEDFDTSYTYYLDRYTCKRLDDYYSKIHVSLSNSQAIWSSTNKPETLITVWRDNDDITKQCRLTFEASGCNVIHDGYKVLRATSMSSDVANVTVNAEYRGNVYSETWNISQPKEGIKGDDAEVYQILTEASVVRPGDLQKTTITILHRSGTDIDYWPIENLVDHGLVLKAYYSDSTDTKIMSSEYTFKDGETLGITHVTLKLISTGTSEVLSILTIPYLPDTSKLVSGQGIYKAMVFKRMMDTARPTTPTGGSWDSPVPIEPDWISIIPEGTNSLWTSTRIFTSDGKVPQEGMWSTPSRISNTEILETMYSSCSDATIVGTPLTNPENWSKTAVGMSYYMATRTVSNGVAGLWQIFAIRGRDGIKSNYKSFIYYQSDLKPATPEGNTPSGWMDYPNSDGTWWMSTATFSGETDELITTWSTPVKITGSDGQNGLQGPYYIYQYAVGNSAVDAPVYGWSVDIPSLSSGQYLWSRSGKVIPPLDYPTVWEAAIRITGERGEKGANGISITIDLTNEVTSIPASYDGVVSDNVVFETSTVQIYENTERINLSDTSKISNISLRCDGVNATIDGNGVITILKWTGADQQETASVTVTATVYGTAYTAIYTINKVKAGAPGEPCSVYSIIPDATTIRRSAGKLEPGTVSASVRRSKGEELTVLTLQELKTEGFVLKYQIDGEQEEEYKGVVTLPDSVNIFTFILRGITTGAIIDKETIPVIESAQNLVVDLDNELSAVACDLGTGKPYDTAIFEKSCLTIYYGEISIPLDTPGLKITDTWTNLVGTFNASTGVINPTGWIPAEYSKDTGSVTLTVSYGSYNKSVTYTIKKINGGVNGVSPEIYAIHPNVSSIKVSSTGTVSYETITVDVTKTVGTTTSTVDYNTWSSKGYKMSYQRTVIGSGVETEKQYTTSGIPVANNLSSITVYFRDSSNNTLDMETIPVVRDGEKGTVPDWKDYIFCNSSTQPNAPTFTTAPAGTLADQYGKVWVGCPNGTAGSTWWMSVATIDGTSLTNAVVGFWSTPIRVTGDDGTNGSGYECQYCNSQNLNSAPAESDAGWSTSVTTPRSGYYTWMRMRTINASGQAGAWQYMRITGETGENGAGIDIKTELYYVGEGTDNVDISEEARYSIIGDVPYTKGDSTYSGLLYRGVSAVAVTGVANGECYTYDGNLFVCTGFTRGYNSWSVSNIKGVPGESYVIYTAYAADKNGSVDKTTATDTWSTGAVWMGTCTVSLTEYPNAPNYTADVWKWAKFQGTDGPGQEFIFYRTNSTSVSPPDVSKYPAVQEDEFKFGGTRADLATTYGIWTDDPQGAIDSEGKRVEWTSYRKKHNGVWTTFSKPAVYANAVGMDSVKTYLTDGNAQITGNLYNLPGWYFKKDGSGWVAGKWKNAQGGSDEGNISKGIYWDTAGNATFAGTLSGPSGTIGGWNITYGGIQIGTSANPTVYLNSDGSGSLANGNISWLANGKLTIKSETDGDNYKCLFNLTSDPGSNCQEILTCSKWNYADGASVPSTTDDTYIATGLIEVAEQTNNGTTSTIKSTSINKLGVSFSDNKSYFKRYGWSIGEKETSGGIGGGYDFTNVATRSNIVITKSLSGTVQNTATLSISGVSTTSDRRLKENVVDLVDRGSLRPVEFNFKGSSEKSVGFIAQEVQEKYPEAVMTGDDGYLSLNYAQLTVALQAQINTLSARILALESELIELKKK